MILLFPIRPKEMKDFPIVTVSLMVLTVLVFLITWPQQNRSDREANHQDFSNASRKVVAVLMDPESGISDIERTAMRTDWENPSFPSPETLAVIERVHAQPDLLPSRLRYDWDLTLPVFDSLKSAQNSTTAPLSPFQSWGFSPEKDWFPGIVTYIFLHDGWLHLLLNLLFFWTLACVTEAAVGWQLIWIYLAGGAASAMAQAYSGLPLGQTLVGASGAIAALMGYCLIVQSSARVQILSITFLSLVPRSSVFDCPLWIFLPIWLLTQILLGILSSHGAISGTAFAAHIGGFLFGVIVGILSRTGSAKPTTQAG